MWVGVFFWTQCTYSRIHFISGNASSGRVTCRCGRLAVHLLFPTYMRHITLWFKNAGQSTSSGICCYTTLWNLCEKLTVAIFRPNEIVTFLNEFCSHETSGHCSGHFAGRTQLLPWFPSTNFSISSFNSHSVTTSRMQLQLLAFVMKQKIDCCCR